MNSSHLKCVSILFAGVLVGTPLFAQAKWGDYHTDKEITASTPDANDVFGRDVDVSGDLAVVTSFGDDDAATSAGAVYVLDRNQGGPGNWGEVYKLMPADLGDSYSFGVACAIDGNLIVASSGQKTAVPFSGAVYLYDAATGVEGPKLTVALADAFDFGQDVDTDGVHVIVGARRNLPGPPFKMDVGIAYVYDAAGNLVHVLTASDGDANDNFGVRVAIDGGLCIVAAPGENSQRGAVYVYDVSTGAQLYKLIAGDADVSDGFGTSVAMEGTRAIIGAPGNDIFAFSDGTAYLFDLATGTELYRFDTEQTAASSAAFGISVAIGGDYAYVGCPGPTSPVGPVKGRIYQLDLEYLYTMAWFVHPDTTPPGPSVLGFAVATDGPTVFNGDGAAGGGIGVSQVGKAMVMTRARIGMGIDKEDTFTADTVTITIRGGRAAAIAGSAVVAIDGIPVIPIVIPGSIGVIDANGEHSFSITIPSGLNGTTLTIMSVGGVKPAGLALTNTRDLNIF